MGPLAAGCEDEEAYRVADWDDAYGAWLVPVVELLDVRAPDVVSGRAHRRGRAEAEAERREQQDAAAAAGYVMLYWLRFSFRRVPCTAHSVSTDDTPGLRLSSAYSRNHETLRGTRDSANVHTCFKA